MRFIDTHWKKGHILGHDRNLFEYEFVNGDEVHFVISENAQGEIDGLEGFIPYGKQHRDVLTAIWKVVKSDNPTLGIEIFQFLLENTDARCVSGPGINKKTIGIYQYLGIPTGLMEHWYCLNRDTEYKIASIADPYIPQIGTEGLGRLRHFESFQSLEASFDFKSYYASNPRPLKEAWYIEKRYFKHPIYQYQVYGVVKEGCVDVFLVFRIQEYGGNRALRLVDVVGNFSRLYGVTNEIDRLMVEYDAEYVDIYEAGLPSEEMKKAGWRQVKESGNTIPNYFSPFVRENIDIYYMSQDADITLFKADGDQDRPN